ncbi:MAG: hypothetical protein ABWY55_11385 [Microbacterium sp.]
MDEEREPAASGTAPDPDPSTGIDPGEVPVDPDMSPTTDADAPEGSESERPT